MVIRFGRFIQMGMAAAALYVAAGCDHHEPCKDMAGTPDMTSSVVDMTETPRDMTVCNPATNPDCRMDMANPPTMDMANPPTMDMANPPTMDMANPPTMDMANPPTMDMANPPTMDMANPPVMDMSMPPADMTMPPRDMSMPGDMSMPPADMTMPPRDMAMTVGKIGDPCTTDMGCSGGPSPKCWKSNVLDNPMAPATPGGYCTSTCTADTDCGTGARCVSVGAGRYCLAACNNATTCRHPGYACSYVAGGVCFPETIYDCDPKATGGACTEPGTMKAGGCIRQAYEDKGNCQATCTVGAGTCPDRPAGQKRQCIYYDGSRTAAMDAFKGTVCYNSVAMPKMPGDACRYINECSDGNQCDTVDGKCHQLCNKGGMPACTTGMCTDAFMTAATGAGICR